MPLEMALLTGMSNGAGQDAGAAWDPFGLQRPHPRLVEYRRPSSFATTRYFAPPAGELGILREPVGDDRTGNIGWQLAFGRARLEETPEIQTLAVLAGAEPESGFNTADPAKSWRPGTALRTAYIDDIKAARASHPEFRVSALVATDWGALEEAGTAEQAFQDDVEDFVDEVRAIPGCEDAVFVFFAMPTRFRDLDPQRVALDVAMQKLCARMTRARYVSSAGMETTVADPAHYNTPEGLAEMGRRIARGIASVGSYPRRVSVTPLQVAPDQVMVYSEGHGQLVDENGSAARIFGGTYEADPDFGTCLRVSGVAPESDLVLNDDAYTLQTWLSSAGCATLMSTTAGAA
ncbi:MAG: hypothetical protein AAFP22_22460, partial [Planctomycetota bacterium]